MRPRLSAAWSVQNFLDGYARGDTPNPCVFCNRYIKWGFLLDYAQSVGADFVSTGHYARILPDPDARAGNGRISLWAGLDPAKDQSYMLSLLTPGPPGPLPFPSRRNE